MDAGFWGGIVPDNAGHHTTLQAMVDSGVLGFKSFMIPSGAPRDGLFSLGTSSAGHSPIFVKDGALQAVFLGHPLQSAMPRRVLRSASVARSAPRPGLCSQIYQF